MNFEKKNDSQMYITELFLLFSLNSTSLIAYKTFPVELYYVENQKLAFFFVSLQVHFGDNFPFSMHFNSPTFLCFYRLASIPK